MAILFFASRHAGLALVSLAITALCAVWLASNVKAAQPTSPSSQEQAPAMDTVPSAFVASGGLVPDQVGPEQ